MDPLYGVAMARRSPLPAAANSRDRLLLKHLLGQHLVVLRVFVAGFNFERPIYCYSPLIEWRVIQEERLTVLNEPGRRTVI